MIDNKALFTYTFSPRTDVDGFTHMLNEGMVGIGTNNAKGRIDNVAVQVLPAEITLSQTDDFNNVSELLQPDVGSWQISGGKYLGMATGKEVAAVSLSQLEINPAYKLQLETTLQAAGTGGIVFDQYSPTDFKYASLSVSTGQIVIGHYTERHGWVVDAYTTQALLSGSEYKLGVTLLGNVVTVTLGGQVVLTKAYNAMLVDGAYGLLSINGTTSFTQLTVTTNDPAYKQTPETDNPPTVEITGSADGDTVIGKMVTFTANAMDDKSVARVEFFINGISIGVDTDGSDGWSITWDSTGYTNGDYVLTTIATDSAGQTTSCSINVKVSNSQTLTVINVGSLSQTTSTGRIGKWNAEVIISILDGSGSPLPGATVLLVWSDGVKVTCTTDANGKCTIKRSNIAKTVSNLTLSVSDVTLPGYVYDPTAAANTSVTVYKPR